MAIKGKHLISKTKQKTWKAKADKLFSEIVRARGSCERCGKVDGLQCAHIISRRYSHVRFNLENTLCLCPGCHFFFHSNPVAMVDFVQEKLGKQKMINLKEVALRTDKLDYQLIYEELKAYASNNL